MASRGGGRNRIKDAQVQDGRLTGSNHGGRVRYNKNRIPSVVFANQAVISRRRSSGVFDANIQPVQNCVACLCRDRCDVHG